MISQNIIQLNYIKKEVQTGSYKGMRYRLEKAKGEEGDILLSTHWPEPFCFSKTPAEQKTSSAFPLTPEGKEAAVNWLNAEYEKKYL